MPDPNMPDTLIESYREEAGSLSATVARLMQELRQAKEEIVTLRRARDDARNRLARLRAGGKA